ncbi:hypothetical protein [Neolewinella sp.]|uniref:hypothetical protein n=1 Tax=Neolewinella sp. TaxID=2993543 RepID=UPI003B524B0D
MKKSIKAIEDSRDWRAAIHLLETIDESSVTLNLRVMFILVDLLVDGQYSDEEGDYASDSLLKIFKYSEDKFAQNAEFMFFTGIMAYIGEWLFGMENVESARILLANALELEPDNVLYKWGYISRTDQRIEENSLLKLELSENILLKNSDVILWLSQRGLLGEYVLGNIQSSYNQLRELLYKS